MKKLVIFLVGGLIIPMITMAILAFIVSFITDTQYPEITNHPLFWFVTIFLAIGCLFHMAYLLWPDEKPKSKEEIEAEIERVKLQKELDRITHITM